MFCFVLVHTLACVFVKSVDGSVWSCGCVLPITDRRTDRQRINEENDEMNAHLLKRDSISQEEAADLQFAVSKSKPTNNHTKKHCVIVLVKMCW